MRVFLLLAFALGNVLPAANFEKDVRPLLQQYCYKCHSGAAPAGNLDLTTFQDPAAVMRGRQVWLRVVDRVKSQEMPPVKPLLAPAERELLVKWIDETVNHFDPKNKFAGHVTIPRLNRTEYNNTIRDLTGIDLRPADAFPEDTFGESGFNNDRDGLFIPPLLIEKYLAASNQVVDELIAAREKHSPLKLKLEAEEMLITESGLARKPYGYDLQAVQNTIFQYVRFPRTGYYRYRLRAWGKTQRPGTRPGIAMRIAGELKAQHATSNGPESPETFEGRTFVKRGNHRVSLHYYLAVQQDPQKINGKPDVRPVTLSVDSAELEEDTSVPPPPDLFVQSGSKEASARKTLSDFATRAYRRPVRADEIDYLMGLFRTADARGDSYEQSVGLALKAVLISPSFLFRLEPEAKLKDYELASRLSYFLWLSTPDAELLRLAGQRKLRDRKVLEQQVARLLADPKSRAFTDAFFSQWLGYRELGKSIVPDRSVFPTFSDYLRELTVEESSQFFSDLFRKDASLLRLLDADYAWLNEDLARHYSIAGVTGRELRRVALSDPNRGGILGMASVLAATSTPVRTSPVIRGKWVVQTLLGDEIPPPPQNFDLAPAEGATARMTLRQRLELHRKSPQCAGCHNRMDPIGFGLETFDAIGRWREQDNGQPVDANGALSSGEGFRGPAELRKILLGKRDQIMKNLTRQLLRFALGRELRYYDEPVVAEIANRAKAADYRAGVLVNAIVASYPFQNQAGSVEPPIAKSEGK